jgi:ATP/ADP translocase
MTQETVIGILAFAALAAVIIFRNKAIAIPTVEQIDASQTIETQVGPMFLTYNQPYASAFFAPTQPPMPYLSQGQIGQSGCATC